MSAMTARVSQENFDEVVKENMEDFEMSPEDAVHDAIEQFHKQGVSLDNLDLSVPNDENREARAAYVAACDLLDNSINPQGKVSVEAIEEDPAASVERVVQALLTIQESCSPQADAPKAPVGYKVITRDSVFRSLLVTNSGIFTLMSMLGVTASKPILSENENENDEDAPPTINKPTLSTSTTSKNDEGPVRKILLATLSCLRLLVKESQELRDAFLAQKLLVRLLKEPSWLSDVEVASSLLALVKASSKATESNKAYFVNAGGLQPLMDAVNMHLPNSEPKVLGEVCMAVGVLCKFDDFRKEMSSAHDNAREISNIGFVPVLNKIAKLSDELDHTQLAMAVMGAVRVLAVNDEIVQGIVASGLLDWVRSSLEKHMSSPFLVSAAIGCFRNISGNDEIKTNLVNNGALDQMLVGMKHHLDVGNVQEHGCGTLAAMALRKPENVVILIEKGGATAVATALKRHPNNIQLQRQGCLAVRNFIVRNQELRDMILDCGLEPLLKFAGKYQGAVDEAYAALRDLGCEGVGMKKYDADGKEIKLQMFGEKKANFNSSLAESNDIENRVQEKATAPAHSNPELF